MYRGAIIGLGNIGLYGHLQAYLHPDIRKEVKIIAGCDLSRENLERFQKLIPTAHLFTDAEKLFEYEKLDFVDICTPPVSHFNLIKKAALKKINILSEKPVTLELETLLEIKKLVLKNKLVFLPGHQYRYSQVWQKIISIIKSGCIGQPYLMQFFVYRREANKGNEYWDPDWRSEIEISGGGIIVDHGSHLFYLASSILGKPEFVTAITNRLSHFKYSVEDTAWINIQYEKGVANLSLTWAAHDRKMEFRILGTDGEIRAMENKITVTGTGGKETVKLDKGLSSDSKHSDWYIPLFREFIDRLDKKKLSMDGIEEAITTTMLISASYKSAEIKKTVAVIG